MATASGTREDSAILVGKEGPYSGERWVLRQGETTLGRADDADIHFDDRRISSRHARITFSAGAYYLEDLGSKNGTFVNGNPVTTPTLLVDGDEVCLALVVVASFVGAGRTVPLSFAGRLDRGLHLDPLTRQVSVNGVDLDPPLSQAQFRLLDLLVTAGGSVCTREEVMAAVWPNEDTDGITEQAIDSLVRRLRERLSEKDPDHAYIVTVRGHGFRLEPRPGV